MNYWRINTDSGARNDLRTCDLWYRFGMAFTGDFAESKRRHDLVLHKLIPGDGVFMHHSGFGIVGFGIVKEYWNQKVYQGAERQLYITEPFEYRIAVEWKSDCDCRENPIPIYSNLPYMGTWSQVDVNKWDVQSVIQGLREKASLCVTSKAGDQRITINYNGGKLNMTNNEELEFETPLEEDVEVIEVPADKRKIYTELGDPEVDSLYGKQKRGKLIVQPDFQRQFVWDTTKASRLIESALLGIPIPVIYLSQEPDNKEYVIDGQQRLTSFFSFMDGKFPDGVDFKLTGLKVFQELNGKKYDALPDELQDDIRYFKLRTITFKKDSDQNLKFEIFERLNTGSVALNDQELRNCIYRGQYNVLLRELSQDSDFTYLLGLKKPDKRMKDIELVLRFAAFYHSTYLNYKPPMKNFLNAEAEKYQNISKEDAQQVKAAFKNACQVIRSMLSRNAFKRFYRGTEKNPSGYWEPNKFNASLFDILMYTFAREDKNILYRNLDSIREAFINLMTDNQDFIDAIELSTSSVQAVTKRFDIWRLVLQSVIGVSQKEPRCFSLQLKESLFKANNTCSICGQRIQEMDDSAIDHIKQYWTGGLTIPENARLTHRYCNWARSRKMADQGDTQQIILEVSST